VEFRIVPHSIRRVNVVEVWVDGRFTGQICPADDGRSLRVISRHATGVVEDTLPSIAPDVRVFTVVMEE